MHYVGIKRYIIINAIVVLLSPLGFIMTPYIETLGFVQVHFVCSLIGGLGLALSAFSTQFYFFFILYGIIGGEQMKT